MIAFALVLFPLGLFVLWLDDNYTIPEPILIAAGICAVVGFFVGFAGIVTMAWRYLP